MESEQLNHSTNKLKKRISMWPIRHICTWSWATILRNLLQRRHSVCLLQHVHCNALQFETFFKLSDGLCLILLWNSVWNINGCLHFFPNTTSWQVLYSLHCYMSTDDVQPWRRGSVCEVQINILQSRINCKPWTYASWAMLLHNSWIKNDLLW